MGLVIRTAILVVTFAVPAGAVRPTDGDGWYGNGYDARLESKSLASFGGHFRVWYVESSEDAVQAGDDDSSGIPDFVERVSERADEVWASTIDKRGFRPPLDDSIYHDSDDYGGDARFDIYLEDIDDADGYLVSEVCTTSPLWCAGYFVMENDFAGFGYSSDAVAIKVLVSHEFMHAIQNAYDADQDRKWSEGTAVWNEEQVFPEQSDFEALINYFLDEPERPFDRAGGSFADFYPYGAALWPTFLGERFGTRIVREIWEACEDTDEDPDFLDAADSVLKGSYSSSLKDAWIEFSRWNLFTDERADATRAYADGAHWGSVRLEEELSSYPAQVTLKSEGMSSRYQPLLLASASERPARLSVEVPEGAEVTASAFFWDGSVLGDEIPVDQGTDPRALHVDLAWAEPTTLFIVVSGATRGALSHDVVVTLSNAPDEVEDTSDDSGCQMARSRHAGGAFLLVLGIALMITRRRRR